jgi:hypothetical protein
MRRRGDVPPFCVSDRIARDPVALCFQKNPGAGKNFKKIKLPLSA